LKIWEDEKRGRRRIRLRIFTDTEQKQKVSRKSQPRSGSDRGREGAKGTYRGPIPSPGWSAPRGTPGYGRATPRHGTPGSGRATPRHGTPGYGRATSPPHGSHHGTRATHGHPAYPRTPRMPTEGSVGRRIDPLRGKACGLGTHSATWIHAITHRSYGGPDGG